MKGAVTVSATSPRCNFVDSATNARIVKHVSAAARLISAAFARHPVLDLDHDGRFAGVGSCWLEPGVPDSTRTGASAARCSAISAMIAAVVLESGG